MEKEAEILDPVGFERHNTCKEEVHSIKLVILEAEKNGIKLDKEECLKTVAPLKFLKCAAIIVIFVIAW